MFSKTKIYSLVFYLKFVYCGFKYADENNFYEFCWTNPFRRPYDPPELRLKAIEAIKNETKANFCDISYIQTVDPWLRHNQTRYKIFVISKNFTNMAINQREDRIKDIVFEILLLGGDHRVEIVARTPEEKPEGHFTEEEMKYIITFLNEKDIPMFGGNRIKREILELHESTTDEMAWKYSPEKTCQIVEEICREKFKPRIFECVPMIDELKGKVPPGHEDQYKILVVSKEFLGQKPLRRTVNVRSALAEIIQRQMYKIHMTLLTHSEYYAQMNISTTTDSQKCI